MLAQARLELGDRLVPALVAEQRYHGEVVLPGRRLVRAARLAADRQHDGALLLLERDALHGRVADEDDRAGRRVEILAVDRELRAAAEDDVHLLVPAGAAAQLVVVLDDVLADALARVDVRPERADPEPAPQRVPDDARDRDRVEVVEVHGLPTRRHRLRSSSSTTGSMRSAPFTRSSRFSMPAQRLERLAQRAVVAEPCEPLAQLGGELVVDLDPLVAGVLPKMS